MKLIRGVAWAVLVVGATACSDSTGPGNDSVVGVYALQSINNTSLPFPLVLVTDEYRLEYTSSILSFAADSSYHERAIVTEKISGAVTHVDTVDAFGLWRQSGTTITMRDVSATETLNAKVSGSTLTLDLAVEDSMYHFVYKKQQ